MLENRDIKGKQAYWRIMLFAYFTIIWALDSESDNRAPDRPLEEGR